MSQSTIARVWCGEERLLVVFWWYYVAASVVLGTAFAVAVSLLAGVVPLAFGTWSLVAVGAVYFIWVSVGLWRCAFNAGSRVWGYAVRVLVVVDVLGAIDFVLHVSQGTWPEA